MLITHSYLYLFYVYVCVACRGLDIDIASIRNKHEQLMLLCVLYVSLCVGVCVVFRLFEPLFLWNYYSVMFMRFHCYGNLTRVIFILFFCLKKLKLQHLKLLGIRLSFLSILKIFFTVEEGVGGKNSSLVADHV